MRVAELIKALTEAPQDWKVFVYDGELQNFNVSTDTDPVMIIVDKE